MSVARHADAGYEEAVETHLIGPALLADGAIPLAPPAPFASGARGRQAADRRSFRVAVAHGIR
jgi:hypothetical protein